MHCKQSRQLIKICKVVCTSSGRWRTKLLPRKRPEKLRKCSQALRGPLGEVPCTTSWAGRALPRARGSYHTRGGPKGRQEREHEQEQPRDQDPRSPPPRQPPGPAADKTEDPHATHKIYPCRASGKGQGGQPHTTTGCSSKLRGGIPSPSKRERPKRPDAHNGRARKQMGFTLAEQTRQAKVASHIHRQGT